MTPPGPQILVIDDEQHQLDTVLRGLRLFGYRCRGVSSVDVALDLLGGADGGSIDLVLTDLAIRGPSGPELLERLGTRWPDLPVVVITGLAAPPGVETIRRRNIPLLSKPFDADTLDATIRRTLGRGQPRQRASSCSTTGPGSPV